jgi:hypothetical protein
MNRGTSEQEKAIVTSATLPEPRTLPLPKDLYRCEGCPYPGVGFICWDSDGTCMRTDEQKFSRRDERRWKK